MEVSRQQGQFSMLVAKHITDTMSEVLRTSDMALWNGNDTELDLNALTRPSGAQR
jgi:hypothetical protein